MNKLSTKLVAGSMLALAFAPSSAEAFVPGSSGAPALSISIGSTILGANGQPVQDLKELRPIVNARVNEAIATGAPASDVRAAFNIAEDGKKPYYLPMGRDNLNSHMTHFLDGCRSGDIGSAEAPLSDDAVQGIRDCMLSSHYGSEASKGLAMLGLMTLVTAGFLGNCALNSRRESQLKKQKNAPSI